MSGAVRAAVVRFPGSNCDLDAIQALNTIPGVKGDLVWHEDPGLLKYDAVILPGGFSFGDFLRGGAIAARSPAMDRVSHMSEKGTPVLGICNGFQVLIEAGLLPGALLRNSSLRFVCKWVDVRVDRGDTPFTRGLKGRVLRMPIAHNEGRYHLPPRELREVVSSGMVPFRYCDVAGRAVSSANPTGTAMNIAGVCNREGNVVGLMPHPERAADSILCPSGAADGALIFDSLVRSFS
jgi:phosphoribosylformylglycinamidine synthase subunit PurQ / glutaminase